MSSMGARLAVDAGKLIASNAISSGKASIKKTTKAISSSVSNAVNKGSSLASSLSKRVSSRSPPPSPQTASASASVSAPPTASAEAVASSDKEGVVVQPSQYELMVTISIVVSAWLISCVIVYVYWYKYNATLEYNRLISEYNTQQLEIQMKKMYSISKAYVEDRSSVTGDEKGGATNVRVDKRMHTEMIKTIDAYERCNFVKESIQASFPYTEVFVSIMLMFGIAALVIMSNVLNNPMQNLDAQNRLSSIREEIRSIGDLGRPEVVKEDLYNTEFKNKFMDLLRKEERELSTKDTITSDEEMRLDDIRDTLRKGLSKKRRGGAGMRGGADMDTKEYLMANQNRLKIIRSKTERLSTELNFMRGDRTFNQVSMSASVLFTTIYLAMLLYSNAVRYNSQLYNSSIFLQSRCI